MSVELVVEAVAVKNSMINALVDALDAGSTADHATIDILDINEVVLATYECSTPAFIAAASGMAVASTITTPTVSDASGTGVSFVAKDRDGDAIFSGSVGTSGAVLNMTSVSFTAAVQPEDITAFTVAMA